MTYDARHATLTLTAGGLGKVCVTRIHQWSQHNFKMELGKICDGEGASHSNIGDRNMNDNGTNNNNSNYNGGNKAYRRQ